MQKLEMNVERFVVTVIGGGLVGAAIAFGMRRLGAGLAVLDEGDRALRASRGNFGLIWVQGKGLGLAPYGGWTQRSAREWPRFAAELRQLTGIDVALRQSGGIHLCFSRRELEVRTSQLRDLLEQPGFEKYDVDVMDHAALKKRLPALGPAVAGGTFCELDGDCNPLRLLRALHGALEQSRCAYRPNATVAEIEPHAGHFTLRTAAGIVETERIVLAAGLGNARLAPMAGLVAPVRPNKGQILVLERVPPFLPLPLETVRQTDDGTVMIGDSQQDAGEDESLDPAVLAAMAARAAAAFPFLRGVRVNRAWAALRVMTPDTFPLYAQSRAHRGAFVVTCHSGVTLAAVHAQVLALALLAGVLPPECAPYSPERFDVRAAA